MHVVVAGCGWLGSEVARRLRARGDRVTAVVRTAASAARLREEGLEAIAADLALPDGARLLPEAFDAVVAAPSAAEGTVEAYRAAYVAITRRLLAAARERGARALVYTSSTGVFGQRDGAWVDESTPPAPAEPTATVLVEAEALVRAASGDALRTCVVRPSGLYGPGRSGTIDRVRSGLLALGPDDGAWMNFAHREDAAGVLIAALDRGRPGAVYHASDAAPSTRRDVVTWIADRLGIAPATRPAGANRANRRVSGEATRTELGLRLAYPSFREGLAPLLEAATKPA